MSLNDKVFGSALAGLLHDVGKFLQRAGVKPSREHDPQAYGDRGFHAVLSNDFMMRYVPTSLQTGLSGVLYHHRPTDATSHVTHLADRWATGDRSVAVAKQILPGQARLVPILSQVELKYPLLTSELRYPLTSLDIGAATTYPADEMNLQADARSEYAALWQTMQTELEAWKASAGANWEKQTVEAYFVTLLAVLRKYLSCMPASTSWQSDDDDPVWPDVSLFDHLRLTSAIAACLAKVDQVEHIQADSEQPITVVVRGDLSGIQNFIYRITRPESETEHVAKRLRGRSFYLTVLVEVIVDWLLRELDLPPNCALFVGGGRFDLLIPLSAQESLTTNLRQLEDWLLKEFHGELSLQVALVETQPADFADMRRVYTELDSQIEQRKRQKWVNHLAAPGFFKPDVRMWHVCAVCQLTPLPEPGICPQCEQQAAIGGHLPHAAQLAYLYDERSVSLPADQVVRFAGAPFRTRVVIVRHDDDYRGFITASKPAALYQLNATNHFIEAGIASTFRFLANVAPRASQRLTGHGFDPIEKNDVLHFEALAELSTGAKRLGIIKADVDRLGVIMGEGLSDEKAGGTRPTIARVGALSSMLDLFFAGQINRVCDEMYRDWQANSGHALADKVTGLFYVVYSGGDDLFVAGPWDAIVRLAGRLNAEFAAYSGHNPNLTLSAGIVQVKPRYPTQKFAELVDEAEKKAKEAGRNRITLFDETVPWTRQPDQSDEPTFDELLTLADTLQQEVNDGTLPRGLLVDLGQVHRQHRSKDGSASNPMWTPRLFYTLSRRLRADARERLGQRLITAMKGGKILVSVSIASLITRKE